MPAVNIDLGLLTFGEFEMLTPGGVTTAVDRGGDLIEFGFTMLEGEVETGGPSL